MKSVMGVKEKKKMKHKQQKSKVLYDNVIVTKISTHKQSNERNAPLHMYVVTYTIGSKRHSQTRHMTASAMEEYKEGLKLDVNSNASKSRGLQHCHLDIKKESEKRK